MIRDALPGLKLFRVGGKGPVPAGVIDFEAAIAAQPGDKLLAPKTLERDTVAALFHTGGTTGLPKLARHTHGALALAAWSNSLMLRPAAGQRADQSVAAVPCRRLDLWCPVVRRRRLDAW